MSKRLVDIAKIIVKAGNGGDGRVSFRREKYIPKGGPDGGDGGSGGSIYIVGDHNMATLMDFRSKTVYKADNGAMGGGKKMSGKSADDLVIKVPIGTLIYEIQGQEKTLIGDITDRSENVPLMVARGGNGGKGNDRFKSSKNRTPMQFTYGGKGEEKELELEIKLVADVGLIGFPNAGKSTLINQITGANAKTANYPFTTLIPNLGVLRVSDGQDIIVADIPGLIEGASEGKGLGDDFLRHVERTRLLVHIIDPMYGTLSPEEADSKSVNELLVDNSIKGYEAIRGELSAYGGGLIDKPEIVVINKIDITEVQNALEDITQEFTKRKLSVFGISAFTGENVTTLARVIIERLKDIPKSASFEPEVAPTKIYTPDNLPNKRIVQ